MWDFRFLKPLLFWIVECLWMAGSCCRAGSGDFVCRPLWREARSPRNAKTFPTDTKIFHRTARRGTLTAFGHEILLLTSWSSVSRTANVGSWHRQFSVYSSFVFFPYMVSRLSLRPNA